MATCNKCVSACGINCTSDEVHLAPVFSLTHIIIMANFFGMVIRHFFKLNSFGFVSIPQYLNDNMGWGMAILWPNFNPHLYPKVQYLNIEWQYRSSLNTFSPQSQPRSSHLNSPLQSQYKVYISQPILSFNIEVGLRSGGFPLKA